MARTKRVSRLTNYVAPAVTLERDRRRERRGPVRRQAQVIIQSGLDAGSTHDVMIRDASMAGSAFYLKDALPVGTKIKLVELVDERPHRTFDGEVVRTRPISNGRHEMAVKYSQLQIGTETMKVLA